MPCHIQLCLYSIPNIWKYPVKSICRFYTFYATFKAIKGYLGIFFHMCMQHIPEGSVVNLLSKDLLRIDNSKACMTEFDSSWCEHFFYLYLYFLIFFYKNLRSRGQKVRLMVLKERLYFVSWNILSELTESFKKKIVRVSSIYVGTSGGNYTLAPPPPSLGYL